MRAIAVAFVVLAANSFAASDAASENRFGAIAYSPSTRAHGWADDYRSRGEAESVALQGCRKHARDCTVPIWFRNGCGALAVGSSGYGTGWGANRGTAENIAVQTCRKHTGNCQIRRWVCTSR